MLIDPPGGWRYGFPKRYDNPNKLPIGEWLVKNGYPKEELNEGFEPHWVRWITEKDETVEDLKKI